MPVLPKPPSRVKDPKTLARFAATRTQCQACCSTTSLEIHHMGDLRNLSRRSDVFVNLMRLCRECHHVKFHDGAAWTKAQLRQMKNGNESRYREEYAELEMQYDGEVLWADGLSDG